MKKAITAVIGIILFVAAYQVTRRQAEYITAQSTITTTPAYVAQPAPSLSASAKNSLAFRFIKPS
ncbi:hypothetical protein [Spirosoma utsteinense]|uniref:Uncharacterized protein n=1 Tax=Spirosoma utsteinense TaxID=2585773 RepID=A0ABR6W112_9BACT|nr:hypothetical protein [Spirosoma utsteinense]MBC3783628.1 hypothetical protein [Spirosoma utsteinense]MBC3790230.1 hypothetical protein [Spirosoma utsteinense]